MEKSEIVRFSQLITDFVDLDQIMSRNITEGKQFCSEIVQKYCKVSPVKFWKSLVHLTENNHLTPLTVEVIIQSAEVQGFGIKSAFEFIAKFDGETGASVEQVLNKLTEEVGEVATGVNVATGYKVSSKLSKEDAPANIREEVVDVIQLAICIGARYGLSHEGLISMLMDKNAVWKQKYSEKIKAQE